MRRSTYAACAPEAIRAAQTALGSRKTEPHAYLLLHGIRYLSNRSMPSSGRYGTAFYDLCGVCAPPSSLNNRSCMGCDGVPRSNKTYDACGLCGGELMLSVQTQRPSLVAYRDSGPSRAMCR